jgi:purine catabolism regulator
VQVREPIEQQFETCARLVLPIITRGVARGYISLIQSRGAFAPEDNVTLAQGALVCAVEMAKVKAVSVAEKRLRGDLIEAILSGSIGATEAARWAERNEFRRSGPYVAITVQWAGDDVPSTRRLETIVNGQARRMRTRVLALARESGVVVFFALNPELGIEEARGWAGGLIDQARAEHPEARPAIGIGRAVEALLELRESYKEATQAMRLERRLRHGKPQYYGDLGVYRLLLPLAETAELRAFAGELLGPLVEYDQAEHANLVETLYAYFASKGNVAQTAKALYIHRNTLIYRLERIHGLTGLDLEDAEVRLKLQLALHALELNGRSPGGE